MTLDDQIKALADDMASNPVSGFLDPRIHRLNKLLTQQADAKRSAERAERALADWEAVDHRQPQVRLIELSGDKRCHFCGRYSAGKDCCDFCQAVQNDAY